MNAESKARNAPSIDGYMIVLDAGQSIVIYERNGESYVADFRNGSGRLEYAHTWFRFHSQVLRYCRSRQAVGHSFMPLTPQMLEKIERLHAESEARQETMLALPRTVAAAAQRYWTNVRSRLRRRAVKTSQTFG
jgi:hypothetical protein